MYMIPAIAVRRFPPTQMLRISRVEVLLCWLLERVSSVCSCEYSLEHLEAMAVFLGCAEERRRPRYYIVQSAQRDFTAIAEQPTEAPLSQGRRMAVAVLMRKLYHAQLFLGSTQLSHLHSTEGPSNVQRTNQPGSACGVWARQAAVPLAAHSRSRQSEQAMPGIRSGHSKVDPGMLHVRSHNLMQHYTWRAREITTACLMRHLP